LFTDFARLREIRCVVDGAGDGLELPFDLSRPTLLTTTTFFNGVDFPERFSLDLDPWDETRAAAASRKYCIVVGFGGCLGVLLDILCEHTEIPFGGPDGFGVENLFFRAGLPIFHKFCFCIKAFPQ
jgi:hypothetical protein